MGDSPEAIRERVKAEELAKGVDPRVAEGRAKAAEARSRQGLPVDPEEAWRAKLAQEGGGGTAAGTAVAGAPAEAPAEVTTGAPEPGLAAAPEAPPAPTAPAPPAPVAGAPATATPVAPAAAAPPSPAAAPPPPEAEPEIGEPIGLETEGLERIAGIAVGDARPPVWLLAVLLAISVWAVSYLVFFAGGNIEEASQCAIRPDHSFVCFQPEGGEGAGAESGAR